jgi:putative MATE family efflux protein
MRIFTDDAPMIEAGTKYLRMMSPSYVLSSFVVVYLAVMRSCERVKMSAVVHSSAVALNVILNACFIFGFWFFPEKGIEGVALATTITRTLEAAVCVIDTLLTDGVRIRIRDFFERNKQLFRDFMRFSLPAAANDMVWGLAFSVYSVILGHLSQDIVSANAVAGVIRNLATVVCFGVSSAAAIMLGKTMGAGNMEMAREYGKRFAYLSVWTAVAGGIMILLTRPIVLKGVHLMVENPNPRVYSEISIMLLINSYYILGQSVNTMLICGIFRAGGDVKFGLICDIFAMWAYAVPIGLFAAFVLKLPEMWVYFILCLDEFVKMPGIIRHYKKRGWVRNLTRSNGI